MRLNDVLNDRETQTGAAEIARPRFIHSIEPFSKAGQVFLGNARAGVGNGNFDSMVRIACMRHSYGAQGNLSSWRSVLDGIIDQVDEQLLQTVQISEQRR